MSDGPLTITALVAEAHVNARNKGWYDDGPRETGTLLALVHSELSEALEEVRDGVPLDEIRYAPNGKPEGFVVELADAIIRIADMCGYYDLPLEQALRVKMAYNTTRSRKHGRTL